jgi:hypothetical protein
MKKKLIKLIKKSSRETIPSAMLKGKIIPSKKKKLLEKTIKRESKQDVLKDD